MSAELESKWISFEDAGKLAGGLHPNTFRQRKCGTDHFVHVPVGRRVMLLRAQVEEWIEEKTQRAIAEERRRQKTFQVIKGKG